MLLGGVVELPVGCRVTLTSGCGLVVISGTELVLTSTGGLGGASCVGVVLTSEESLLSISRGG